MKRLLLAALGYAAYRWWTSPDDRYEAAPDAPPQRRGTKAPPEA